MFGCEGGGSGSSLGVTGISGGCRKKEWEKMGNDKCRCPFSWRTAWASQGLPLPGSPLTFLHPQLPCWLTRSCPHPSEEGRSRCGWHLLMALQVEVNQRHGSGHVQKRDAKSCDLDLLKLATSLSPTTYLCLSPPSPVPLPQKMWARNAPQHLSNNTDAGTTCHCPHPLLCHVTRCRVSRTPPQSAPTLLSATSLDVERQGCLPWSATALAPSALPRHLTSSVEDAPGLPQPSSLPCHLTLSIEDTSPGLPMQCPCTLRFATSPNIERQGRPQFVTALLSAMSPHI